MKQFQGQNTFCMNSNLIQGMVHVICGSIAFGSALALVMERGLVCFTMGYMGTGIWCGVFFCTSGILCLAGVKNKKASYNAFILTIVMSVFSAGALIGSSVPGLVNKNRRGVTDQGGESVILFYGLQLVVGVIEMVLAIISTTMFTRRRSHKKVKNIRRPPFTLSRGKNDFGSIII